MPCETFRTAQAMVLYFLLNISQDNMLKEAPDFSLLDEAGVERKLSDYRGKVVLLYFYPKDMTPGCTTEAKCIRDRMNDLKAAGVEVLGVSTDSVASHKKFKAKYGLNFPLLADVEKKVVSAYGVWKKKSFLGRSFMGTARESFLIDRQGMIVKHYKKVKPAEHAAQVLADARELKL